MIKKIIILVVFIAASSLTAQTVSPDAATVEVMGTLVDPFTLEQIPINVEVNSTDLITTQDNDPLDYRFGDAFFTLVRPEGTASKAILVGDGNNDWSWYRPIIVPGRPNHRSPFTPDAEY